MKRTTKGFNGLIIICVLSLAILAGCGGGGGTTTGTTPPAAGTPDATFGTGGKVTTAIGVDDVVQAVAIQADGKIVAAGFSFNGADYDFALVRYNSNGSLDTTFNTTGKITTAIGTGDDVANAVAIQADGKIVAAGYSKNGTNYDFAVVRYNSNGSLDITFGTGGKVTTAIRTGDDLAYAVAIQADGKIVVAGASEVSLGINKDFAVVRYNPDGNLDLTFNTTGMVTTAIGTGVESAQSVAIQSSDGKIVAAGYSFNGADQDFAVVRYNPDGNLDLTFNTTGKVTTAIGTSDDAAQAVAIQSSDGKIVAAGASTIVGLDLDFAVVRYNPDGSLDTSFGTGGTVTTAIGAGTDAAHAVAIQSDDKIVAAGLTTGTNMDFAVVRYNPNGSLDLTFNTTGKVTTAIGTGHDVAQTVCLDSNGRIVAAGYSLSGANYDFAVVRYVQ